MARSVKTCSKCHKTKPLDAFCKNSSKRDGYDPKCRQCYGEYYKQNKARRQTNNKNYYIANRKQLLEQKHRQHLSLKLEVVAAYGGQCQCSGRCSVSHPEFLAIDHIFGGGAKERKQSGFSGSGLYLRLKKAGFPKDKYRLLCHNCNQSIGAYGYCPHERINRKLLGGTGSLDSKAATADFIRNQSGAP